MVAVSILIPSFKSTYLKKSLDSALAQTFEDVEILVGDDTLHGDLERITKQYDNPKIKYLHHGFQDAALNCKALWEKSSGQYIKWLYDDVLLPTSVEVLVSALRAHPQAVFAFHERVFIDENDKVIGNPPRLLGDGQIGLIDRAFLVQNMISASHNFVGEPSNILLNKSLADLSPRQYYKSWRLQFLTDVGKELHAHVESDDVVTFQRTVAAGERRPAIGDQQLRLAEFPGVEEDLPWRGLVQGCFRSEGELHRPERSPAALTAPTCVQQAAAHGQKSAESLAAHRRHALLQAALERVGPDRQDQTGAGH